MSYEPTNWKTGDVVTSAKLNKLENAVAGGKMLVVHDTNDTLDKTWQEIYDAFLQNDLVVLYEREEENGNSYQNTRFIIGTSYEDGIYYVSGFNWGGSTQPLYTCTSPSEYPKYGVPSDDDVPGGGPVS